MEPAHEEGDSQGPQPPLKVWNWALKKQQTCTQLICQKKPQKRYLFEHTGRETSRMLGNRLGKGGKKDKEGGALTLGAEEGARVAGW